MCDRAQCQTCQTYGSRDNPLFEIAVDDNEGIYQCADCLHTENVVYSHPPNVEIDPALRVPNTYPAD